MTIPLRCSRTYVMRDKDGKALYFMERRRVAVAMAVLFGKNPCEVLAYDEMERARGKAVQYAVKYDASWSSIAEAVHAPLYAAIRRSAFALVVSRHFPVFVQFSE